MMEQNQQQISSDNSISRPSQVARSLLEPVTSGASQNEEIDLGRCLISPVTEPKSQLSSFFHRLGQLFVSQYEKETGLAHLTIAEFMEVKQKTEAFAFAVNSALKEGWWSSLLQKELLKNRDGREFRKFLRTEVTGRSVLEIGAGDNLPHHRYTTISLGAKSYTGIDLQPRVLRHQGIQVDALEYLAARPSGSIGVIMAFGVFNEPMSLQYPARNPPIFWLPARNPNSATRANAEHEYVRRLTTELYRVLADDGLFFGDGLFSRGFEQDVAIYLKKAGFSSDLRASDTLMKVDWERFHIREPFFFRKSGFSA